MTQIYRQFGQVPFNYANGLAITNDATTPNSLINVGAGSVMDSTGNFQMVLSASVTGSNLLTSLNGLDTGAVAASKVYAIYLVGDPVKNPALGIIFSLNQTTPVLPTGYSIYALIGYAATDASKNWLKGYWTAGNGTSRLFMFDAPQATAITAGASTTYANVDLTKWVPLVNNLPVWLATAFTPGAASRTLKMTPGNGVGDAVTITGQVTSVIVTSNSLVLAQNVVISTVNSPTVLYKVSNAGDAAAINIAGYQFFI